MSWPVYSGGTPDVRGAFVAANDTSATRNTFSSLLGTRSGSVADANPGAGSASGRLTGVFQQAQTADLGRVAFGGTSGSGSQPRC